MVNKTISALDLFIDHYSGSYFAILSRVSFMARLSWPVFVFPGGSRPADPIGL